MNKTIAIAVIETRDHTAAELAVLSTLKSTPASKVYWVSNQKPRDVFGCETHWIRIRHFDPTEEIFNNWYSRITLRLLPNVVDADFNIIVQSDGYAFNEKAWTEEFLQYDYIGAPWLWWGTLEEQIGNGGFSLRSRKLYDALIDWEPGYLIEDWPYLPLRYYNPGNKEGLSEDNLIAGPYRPILEKRYGCKWPSIDLAHRWSIEGSESYNSNWFKNSLGFHGRETALHYGIKIS